MDFSEEKSVYNDSDKPGDEFAYEFMDPRVKKRYLQDSMGGRFEPSRIGSKPLGQCLQQKNFSYVP